MRGFVDWSPAWRRRRDLRLVRDGTTGGCDWTTSPITLFLKEGFRYVCGRLIAEERLVLRPARGFGCCELSRGLAMCPIQGDNLLSLRIASHLGRLATNAGLDAPWSRWRLQSRESRESSSARDVGRVLLDVDASLGPECTQLTLLGLQVQGITVSVRKRIWFYCWSGEPLREVFSASNGDSIAQVTFTDHQSQEVNAANWAGRVERILHLIPNAEDR